MKYFLGIIPLLFFVLTGNAQEAIGSAGQNDKTSKVQVSWNLGETIINQSTVSTGSVTQGYEQPHFVITSIELIMETSKIKARVFPNPVVNNLNIEFNGLENEVILLKIYDAQGRLVFESSTNENSTQLDLSPYSGSHYHLTLQTKNQSYYEKFSLIKSH